MSDNVVKSTDVLGQTEKKAPAKKPAAKKAAVKKEVAEKNIGHTIIVFDSGASYTCNEYRFTSDARIQEIPTDLAQRLLELDNFRLADQLEIEEFIKSKGE